MKLSDGLWINPWKSLLLNNSVPRKALEALAVNKAQGQAQQNHKFNSILNKQKSCSHQHKNRQILFLELQLGHEETCKRLGISGVLELLEVTSPVA